VAAWLVGRPAHQRGLAADRQPPGIRDHDLGAFLALNGLHGACARPTQQYNRVSIGGLQANASVGEVQLQLASGTDLGLGQRPSISAQRRRHRHLSMNRWQNWLV
jgi:hypothetical protein